MAEKFVRSTKGVRDIDTLSTNLIEVTDVVSTEDGKLYMKSETEFVEIGGSSNEGELEQVKTDVTSLKSENTKLKNRVTELETKATELETKSADFESRIKALENPADETPAE